MWVPKALTELFTISRETVDKLREELATTRAERDVLRLQLATAQNHFDWLRVKVNTLEIERAQLIEKAYGLKIPVPEIVRTPVMTPPDVANFSFEDMGDVLAKKLGLPDYSN